MGKETMSQRGEDREKPVTSLPTLQKTQVTRTEMVPVVGTYIPVSLLCPLCCRYDLTVMGEATQSRQHMDGRKKQLSASRLLTQWHWWIPSGQHPTQSPEKGKSKPKSFIPACFIQLSSSYKVQKEVIIMSPTDFSCYTMWGFFFLCRKIYASFECFYL